MLIGLGTARRASALLATIRLKHTSAMRMMQAHQVHDRIDIYVD